MISSLEVVREHVIPHTTNAKGKNSKLPDVLSVEDAMQGALLYYIADVSQQKILYVQMCTFLHVRT